jgi:hypothetical protein
LENTWRAIEKRVKGTIEWQVPRWSITVMQLQL